MGSAISIMDTSLLCTICIVFVVLNIGSIFGSSYESSEDISRLTGANLIEKLDRISTCTNSAEDDLGSTSFGRWVGSCNSGDVLSSSQCIFQCYVWTGEFATCAHAQCENGTWRLVSGQVCCHVPFQPEGCCSEL